MDGSVIADARVGLAAVGPNSAGIPAISEALSGREPSEELYAQAGSIAAASCSPVTDSRGTADYKRHLADELTRRTLRRSVERIRAGEAGDRAGGPREDQGGDG
jgi:carbon-monoxide dehydrogenase medium subunit